MQTIEFNEKLEFLFKPARLSMTSGIYGILNLLNGKIYIGSAVYFRARWRQHRHELKAGKHPNKYLQQSYNKNGAFAFEFLILETVLWKSDLVEREDYWLKLTDSFNPQFGYNICKKASSSLGVIRSEATRLKISKANKNRKRSLEFKAKLSKAVTGKKHTPEAIANMIEAQKKNDKRRLDKWPHELGRRCRCVECKDKKRIYIANYRAAAKNGNRIQ